MNALTSFFTGGSKKAAVPTRPTNSTNSASIATQSTTGPTESFQSSSSLQDVYILRETQAKIREMAAGRNGNQPSAGVGNHHGWTQEKQILSETRAKVAEMAADPKGTNKPETETYDPTNPVHQMKLQQIYDQSRTMGQMSQIQAQIRMETQRREQQNTEAKREEDLRSNPVDPQLQDRVKSLMMQ